MDLKSFDIQVPNIETLLKLQPGPEINESLMRNSLLEDIATISIEIKNQNSTLTEEKVFEQASSSLMIKQQSLIASFAQKIELMINQMNQSKNKQIREREPEVSAKKIVGQSNGRGKISQKSKREIDKPQRKLRFETQDPQIQSLGTSLYQETKDQSRISIKQMPSALKNNRHIVGHCSSEKKRQHDSPSLSPQRDNVPTPIQIAPQPQKLNKTQSESIIKKPLIESESIFQKESEQRISDQLQTQLEEQDIYIEQIEQLNIEQQHLISELQLKIKKYEKLEMINEKIKQENKELQNNDFFNKQLRELLTNKQIVEYGVYEEKQTELLKVQKDCDDKIAKLIIQKTKVEEQIKDKDNEITKQQKYIQELLEIVENQEHFQDELLKKEKQISDIYEQTQQQHKYLEKKDKEQEADHFLIKKLEIELNSLRQIEKNFNDLKNDYIRLQEKCSQLQEQNLNFKEEIGKLTELYLNQKRINDDLLLNQKPENIQGEKSDKKPFHRSNEIQSYNIESGSQNYKSSQTQDSQIQRSHEKYDQQKEILQKKFENLQYQLSGILSSKSNFYNEEGKIIQKIQMKKEQHSEINQQTLFESKFLKRPFSFQQNDFESKSLYGTPFHKQKSQRKIKENLETYQGAYFYNEGAMNSGDENSEIVRVRRVSGKIVSQSGNKPSPRVKTFSESLLKSAKDSTQVRKFLDQKIKNLQSSLGRDLEKARSTRLKF